MRDENLAASMKDLRGRFQSEALLRDFLLSGKARESLICDFKGGIPDANVERGRDGETPQYSFCKAIAAFANSKGGFIVVGVADQTLEVKGCTFFSNLDNRVEELKKQVNPKPDAKVLYCYPLIGSEKHIYVIEVLPSPSFRKPHFFRGKIFYRASDASRCDYVNSLEELSEEVKGDCFHKGSVPGFKRYIQILKDEVRNLKFPFLSYQISIGEFLERRRRDEPGNSNVLEALRLLCLLNSAIEAYKPQSPSASTEAGAMSSTATYSSVIDSIDSFASAFISVLEEEASFG